MPHSIGIVGGGVSGLATAFWLQQRLDSAECDYALSIYEADADPGGTIRSSRKDGFVVEWGPNGFLNSEPATFDLLTALGLRENVLRSRDAARRRYILIGDRLEKVPEGADFISSRLLPPMAKLRFALEPFVVSQGPDGDETVGDFVRRRFGPVAVDRMFDPLVSGVYAGDVERLSINSTFSVFAEMEAAHGSVVRGMFVRLRQLRRESRERAQAGIQDDPLLSRSKNPMKNVLLSFPEGMGELIETLRRRVEAHPRTTLRLASRVASLERRVEGSEQAYQVGWVSEDGSRHAALYDQVILAVPPSQAGRLVEPLHAELGRTLGDIEASSIAVVALGYRREDVTHALDGFGFLIPRRLGGRRTLGNLWSSSIFDHRAPDGHVLLTFMIGGAHDAEAVRLDDEELTALVRKELGTVMGLTREPVLKQIVRHEVGIPQYNVGHRERLGRIYECLQELPGLHVTGNGFHGISMNDCVRTGQELSQRIKLPQAQRGHADGSRFRAAETSFGLRGH